MTTERTHCAKCGRKLTEKNWILNISIKKGVRYKYIKTVCRPCINERERLKVQRERAEGLGPDGATRPDHRRR